MLDNFIPNKSYAIVSGYDRNGNIVAVLGGVIYHKNTIELFFPKSNPFTVSQAVTFHLDNRTGVEEIDPEMRVYRTSVKAKVIKSEGLSIFVELIEYELKFSNTIVDNYKASDYQFPTDTRSEIELEEAVFSKEIVFNDKEKDNKLGVLITKAIERPHTTVMAFISSIEDDIYIISHSGSFKSKNIRRDKNCVFAIDHRATYLFTKAIDWNYTLIKGTFKKVSKDNEMFPLLQAKFVEKNPWEFSFFTDDKVEMYQIKAEEILCPEKY